jgi:hypothetical protein
MVNIGIYHIKIAASATHAIINHDLKQARKLQIHNLAFSDGFSIRNRERESI